MLVILSKFKDRYRKNEIFNDKKFDNEHYKLFHFLTIKFIVLWKKNNRCAPTFEKNEAITNVRIIKDDGVFVCAFPNFLIIANECASKIPLRVQVFLCTRRTLK